MTITWHPDVSMSAIHHPTFVTRDNNYAEDI